MNYSARFFKCALQVDPYNYSRFRGKEINDEQGYNQQILITCLKNDISVVGLADHGNCDNSENLRKLLMENGIQVFPGFEITTAEKIHIVCLFDEKKTISDLNKCLGSCGLENSFKGTDTSSKTCLQLSENIKQLGGFWYAAHISNDNGILKLGQLHEIWKNENFIAAQIPESKENIDPNFKNIINNTDPAYKRDNEPGYINACDIETPIDLEKKNATTWIKMTEPTFDNFRMAFKDPKSRIKLNYDREETYQTCIKHLSIHGGYLDRLEVDFSDNLTTIIGGRGTGKSTIINIIRYALDMEPENFNDKREFNEMIKNNLGTGSRVELSICSNSRFGESFKIIRRYNQEIVVEDCNKNVSKLKIKDILPMIEIYGQNEIVEMVSDVSCVMKAVSRLLPNNEQYLNDKKEIYKKLQKNSNSINVVLKSIEKITEEVSDLPALEEKLDYYKKNGLEEKLEIIKQLATEESSLESFEKSIETFKLNIIKAEEFDVEKYKEAEEFVRINKAVETYNLGLGKIESDYTELTENLKESYFDSKKNWIARKESSDHEIQKILSKLEGIKDKTGTQIVSDYTALIIKIERAVPYYKKKIREKKQLTELISQRSNLIEECRKINDIYEEKTNKLVKRTNNKKLEDRMKVHIYYRQNKGPIISFLQEIDGVGGKAVEGIKDYENFDIFTFADDIRKGHDILIKKYHLTNGIAEKISMLSKDKIMKIEELQLEDTVRLELNVNGKYKDLNNLSKGQQCTAILNILLLDNVDPLLIDQPEDNLDNSFIANNLVDNIRSNKIKRQYIFATHNANIPVFGDAELIIAMQEEDGRGKIINQGIGSIDDLGVRTQVIEILEGGREAFRMRAEKYGL